VERIIPIVMTKISIDQIINWEHFEAISKGETHLSLSEVAQKRISSCFDYLQQKLNGSDRAFYGINTGFGSLCNVKISKNDLSQLQENIVMSHACGTGKEVILPIVRLMLALKVQSLSYGHSGVQLITVQRLVEMYNHDVLPVVFEQGSLGASGDLAPLAHLCLPLIGRGEVVMKGVRMTAKQAMDQLGWEPIALSAKEGLALLNGTQFMSAFGIYNWFASEKLYLAAHAIGALSLEGFNGTSEPFTEQIHRVRPHAGQSKSAEIMRNLLAGSSMQNNPGKAVQDPYSFRCIPQVHGATFTVLQQSKSVYETEASSVTDNPLIFPEDDLILSGGNFHGQVLALTADQLSLAVHELGNISERRTYLLISGQRDLPAFLVKNSGLNSGFMIPQYTAASIVSKTKQMCNPSSSDSIVSSNGQEDHVSMGANAAVKCFEIIQQVKKVLAIEWLNAAQAFDLRKEISGGISSSKLEQLHLAFRSEISFMDQDREIHFDMAAAEKLMDQVDWRNFH
jgi:histidine ammonia-lyase